MLQKYFGEKLQFKNGKRSFASYTELEFSPVGMNGASRAELVNILARPVDGGTVTFSWTAHGDVTVARDKGKQRYPLRMSSSYKQNRTVA